MNVRIKCYDWSMGSIRQWWQKIKQFVEYVIKEWGVPILILLVATASFGLGRISAVEKVRPPVSIIQAPRLKNPQGIYPGGLVEASRTGTVYYFPWCGGASNIIASQAIWFKTEAAAKAAGYRPAKNCKGLVGE
jgi:hypothetical protein